MKLKKLKKGKNQRYKSRYQAGGMYGNNTVSSAGQGNVGSTSSIVYQESNPEILKQNIEAESANKDLLMQQSQDMALKVDQMDEQAKIDVSNAKIKSDAKFSAGESLTKSGLGAIQKGLSLAKPKDRPNGLAQKDPALGSQIANSSEAGASLGSAVTKVPGSELGTPLNIPGGGTGDVPFGAMGKGDYGASSFQAPAPTAPVSATYVPPTSNVPVSTATPTFDLSKTTVDGASAGKGIGAGIKAFRAQRAANRAIKSGKLLASSAGTAAGAGWSAMGAAAKGNIIGAGASLLGAGIKKIGGDDDDTELNAAEWSGDLLSGAGTGIGVASTIGTIGGAIGMGAAMGSAVPLLGTAIGAVAGLGYGAYKAISGRKKARKAEADAKAARAKKVGTFNKELTSSFGAQKARVSAAKLAQKTYSGYDLGSNVTARNGGMRMGMPRYGYAS